MTVILGVIAVVVLVVIAVQLNNIEKFLADAQSQKIKKGKWVQ